LYFNYFTTLVRTSVEKARKIRQSVLLERAVLQGAGRALQEPKGAGSLLDHCQHRVDVRRRLFSTSPRCRVRVPDNGSIPSVLRHWLGLVLLMCIVQSNIQPKRISLYCLLIRSMAPQFDSVVKE